MAILKPFEALPELVTRTPVNGNGVPYITTARAKFRDAFLTFDTTDNWTLVQTGSGQTITVAGATGGSRYLNIASGTTINSETIIVSRQTFKAPSSVLVGLSMSQRIANCDAFVEIVEVDDTGAVLTDTTQPSAVFNNARNAAAFQFTGTTATSQRIQVRQDGLSEESAAITLTTTAATGTNPNFIPAGQFEITLRTRDIQFSSMTINAVAAKVAPTGSLRNTRVPNPDGLYALRIRVKNGGTAPASNTDVRIHSVTVLDDTRLSVDFGSIAGVALPQNAPPVQVVNTVGISGAVTMTSTTVNPVVPATPYFVNSAATTNGALILTGTSNLSSFYATNEGASVAYVKLYNKATAPTVGTDVPEMIIPVPAAASGIPGVANPSIGFHGLRFALGLGIAITRNAVYTDTTAVGAGEVKVKLSRTV